MAAECLPERKRRVGNGCAVFVFRLDGARAMDVHIIEIKTGKLAAIPIDLTEQNRSPSEPEFFATAWRVAVEDSRVDPARRDDYSFRLMRFA
jgi:hypothetical protein